MTDWKKWLQGLIGAAINSASGSIALWVVDPADFNLHSGLVKLAKIAFVSAVVGAALYLKQHPAPWFEMSLGGGSK